MFPNKLFITYEMSFGKNFLNQVFLVIVGGSNSSKEKRSKPSIIGPQTFFTNIFSKA